MKISSLLKAALLLAAFQSAGSAFAQDADCKADARLSFICGVNRPEDMVVIEGTPWVLVSNLGDEKWAHGGFNIVDSRSRRVTVLKPDLGGQKDSAYRDCPGAPDAIALSAHGLSVRPEANGRHSVYAVNHGGRRSIEVYDLDVSAAPRLTWKGCVVMPPPLIGNSVAHLPGASMAVTVLRDTSDPKGSERLAEGLPSGFALEWSPTAGWTFIPGSEISGNNGIVATPDGKWLFINGSGSGTINKLSRGAVPYKKETRRVGFVADNIRWTRDAKLIVAGTASSMSMLIEKCGPASSHPPVCPLPSTVVRVDPETMKVDQIMTEQATKNFGAASGAIIVGDELWVGSFLGNRIGTVKLKQLEQ